MDAILREKCDLLAENRSVFVHTFGWASGMMNLAAAYLFTSKGKRAESMRLKECEAVLKKKAGLFSDFRGNVKTVLISRMMFAEDPEIYFDHTWEIYQLLKSGRLLGDEYRVMAALIIADYEKTSAYEAAVEKTYELYRKMKENHRWLTNSEDIPFAALLAVSGMNTDRLVDEMEACYSLLKDRFVSKDAIQSLSHVLALDEQMAEIKCERVRMLFDRLKAAGHKSGTGFELVSLGVLAMLSEPVELLAAQICEADDYLKGKKGFSGLTMDSRTRRMYAALLVLGVHSPKDSRADGAVLAGTLAITIALEVCMMVIMTSSIAANSAN